MRRAAWRPLRVARVRRLAPGPVGRRRALGPRCLPTMPQRVLVSLLLLPEAKQLRRRASEHCRLARHPPVLPLTHHRPRAGALSVCTSCRVMAARAALRRSHTDAHTRQIDAFECRDDLDVNGNWFNKSATTGDDGRGIPSLGFLRVVRGAKPTAAKPAPHRPRSDRTPVRCRAAPRRAAPCRAAPRRAMPRHAEARTTQIRLVRIFRVFKFGRYSLGLQMFVGCLKASTQARAPSGRSSLHHLGLGLAFPKVTAWLI